MSAGRFRRWLLRRLQPFVVWWGRTHAPFSHKLVTATQVIKATKLAQAGDVILTRTDGELSNILQRGFYKHASILVDTTGDMGFRNAVEAVGAGVRETTILSLLITKDCFVILRPTFASPAQAAFAGSAALAVCGRPYDFDFEPGEKAFYCSELITYAYDLAMAPGASPFTRRVTLGVDTVVPQDFRDAVAVGKFEVVYEFTGVE